MNITYPGQNVIGSCSLCGGPVVVPSVWYGTMPPVPTCAHCGATKKENHGPVIDMVPSKESMLGNYLKKGSAS